MFLIYIFQSTLNFIFYTPCKIESTFKQDNVQICTSGTCRILVEEDQTSGYLYLITKRDQVYFDDELTNFTSSHKVSKKKLLCFLKLFFLTLNSSTEKCGMVVENDIIARYVKLNFIIGQVT